MSAPSTPRSRSRSKRSTTNLRDLRLAPLSAKFTEPAEEPKAPKSPYTPYEETPDAAFVRQHSSYLQGKSAPTSPGILSRSSSRRHLGAGLSRKSEVYEADAEDQEEETSYTYAGPTRTTGGERVEFGSGQIAKAKSEAALLPQQKHRHRLSGQGVPVSKTYRYPGLRSGTVTPKNEHEIRDETWLTHTGATASALVQQDKGLSWLASRANSTSLAAPESEDDDDDQYEEMAKLSASTANLQLAEFDGGSPVSTRVSRWGSRYGSRSASRRNSRINSPVGTRTPRRADAPGYFDDYQPETPKPDAGFTKLDEHDEEYEDEKEVERLSAANSFGLGKIVDRVMNFNIFRAEDAQETTDDEVNLTKADETVEEAKERQAADLQRKKKEKARLTAQPAPAPTGSSGTGEGEVAGWVDAAWLLSVATKAMF